MPSFWEYDGKKDENIDFTYSEDCVEDKEHHNLVYKFFLAIQQQSHLLYNERGRCKQSRIWLYLTIFSTGS